MFFQNNLSRPSGRISENLFVLVTFRIDLNLNYVYVYIHIECGLNDEVLSSIRFLIPCANICSTAFNVSSISRMAHLSIGCVHSLWCRCVPVSGCPIDMCSTH